MVGGTDPSKVVVGCRECTELLGLVSHVTYLRKERSGFSGDRGSAAARRDLFFATWTSHQWCPRRKMENGTLQISVRSVGLQTREPGARPDPSDLNKRSGRKEEACVQETFVRIVGPPTMVAIARPEHSALNRRREGEGEAWTSSHCGEEQRR